VEYDYTILDELEPAYAVTIHKSQEVSFRGDTSGVSRPSVLMTRNLLYTAITRARELVILVGNKDCLYGMIMNDRETKRNSDLAENLENA